MELFGANTEPREADDLIPEDGEFISADLDTIMALSAQEISDHLDELGLYGNGCACGKQDCANQPDKLYNIIRILAVSVLAVKDSQSDEQNTLTLERTAQQIIMVLAAGGLISLEGTKPADFMGTAEFILYHTLMSVNSERALRSMRENDTKS